MNKGKRIGRRALCLIVSLVMVCTLVPHVPGGLAYAEDNTQAVVDQTTAPASEQQLPLEAESEHFKATVTYGPEAGIPEGAYLVLTEFEEGTDGFEAAKEALVADEEGNSVYSQATEEEQENMGMAAFDLTIYDAEGNMVEPSEEVAVNIEVLTLPDGADAETLANTMEIQHLNESTGDVVVEKVATVDSTEAAEVESVSEIAVDTERETAVTDFTVNGFSTFVLTWGDNSEYSATIHYGQLNTETHEFEEFEDEKVVTLDTTTSSVDLDTNFDGKSFIGATYKATASSEEIDVSPARLTKISGGWQITTVTHNSDDTTTTNTVTVANGSDIYVYYGTKQSHGESPATVNGPVTTKDVSDNGDGTYDITLDLESPVTTETDSVGANVLVVLDTTYSMASSMTGATNRFEAARSAILTLIDSLDCGTNDIDLALVEFNSVGSIKYNWTKDYTTFRNYIANTVQHATGPTGTNWESGLYYARQVLQSKDRDATYVIFLTDGEPNRRGTTSSTNAGTSTAISYALTQAQAITGTTNTSLYGVFCGSATGYNNLANMISSAGGTQTINGTDQDTIRSAFADIAHTIVTNLGSSNVSVDDGVTTLSSVSSAVAGEAGGYEYYISYKITPNAAGTSGTYKDSAGAEHTVSLSDSNVWSKTTGEGSEEVTTYYYKTTWTDAPGATYSADNGVTWDLSSKGTLPSDTIFTVKFTVWPSQEAYDLIADLNNGITDYDTLPQNIKDQIGGNITDGYYMITNTHLLTTYTYSGETYTDSSSWEEEDMPLPTETISVKKTWNNPYDPDVHNGGAGVDLYVTKDNADYLYGEHAVHVTAVGADGILDTEDDWISTQEIYISCGSIEKSSSGYKVLEVGHDYSIAEPEEFAYHWDLTADVYHPMVINGTATMLILDEDASGTDGTDYYTIGGKKYRVAGEGENVLMATNDRRSNLNLTKAVTDLSDDQGADPDELFEYTCNFGGDEDIYFSAWANNAYQEIQGTGISKEITDDPDKMIDDTGWTGYYYASSGSDFTIKIKAGWNIRFINLLCGTEYTITEGDMSEGYAFVSAEGEGWNYSTQAEEAYSINVEGTSASGKITNSNRSYTITFTNEYEPTAASLTVSKTWEAPSTITAHGDINVALYKNVEGTLTYIEGSIRTISAPATSVTYDKLSSLDGIVVREVKVEGEGETQTITPVEPNGTIDISGETGDTTTNTYAVTYEEGTASENARTDTITNKFDVTKVTVTKTWSDGNDQDGKRADVGAEVQLYKTVGETKTAVGDSVAVGAADNWSKVWENLPVYENGTQITYSVEETLPEDSEYTKSGDDTTLPAVSGDSGTVAITNSYTPETTKVTATKTWSDSNNQDGKRPTTASVRLYKTVDGTKTAVGDPVTVPATDGQINVWENLPVYENGKQITYSVEETLPANSGYTKSGDTTTLPAVKDNSGTVAITNSYTPESTTVTATKTWSDSNNQDGKRPTTATVQLYKTVGGTKTAVGEVVTVPATDGQIKQWTGLPVYENGTQITYSVEETLPAGSEYTKSGDTTTLPAVSGDSGTVAITNSYTPESTKVTVTKTWSDSNDQDGKRADVGATVQLYKTVGTTKTAVGDPVAVGTADDWSKVWENLPVYENGTQITYSVTETLPANSEYTKSGDDTTLPARKTDSGTIAITNSYTPETTKISASKVWDDSNDQDGKRPTTATVQLYKTVGTTKTAVGQAVTVPVDGGTINEWTGLPVYEGGTKIYYSVEETLPTGTEYTKRGDGTPIEAVKDNTGNVEITNSYATEDTTVEVDKIWDDASNQDGKRPATATVQLYKTVGTTKTAVGNPVTVGSDENTWNHVWEDLPVYENKTKIVYSVTETLPDGTEYTKSGDTTTLPAVSGNSGKITITNSYTPETTKVTATKTWSDTNNQDGKRPTTATVQLYKTVGETKTAVGEAVTVPATDGTIKEWTNLPVYENGTQITYSVEETLPEGSEYTKSGDDTTLPAVKDNSGTVAITNSYTPETTKVTATKTWSDENDQDGKRSGVNATVQLYKTVDGTKTAVGSSVNVAVTDGTIKVWENLPVYEGGKKITYSVEETLSANSGYTKSGDDITLEAQKTDSGTVAITNAHETEKTDLTVTKVWDDFSNMYSTRPESLAVTLNGYIEGEDDPVSTATVDLEPAAVQGDDGAAGETTEPAEGQTEAASADEWTYTWENLPVYNSGKEITYKVAEVRVPEGYIGSTDEVEVTKTEDGYTVEIKNELMKNLEVTVEKKFTGLTEKRLPKNFQITATYAGPDGEVTKNFKLNSEGVTVSEDKMTYSWKITNVPFGANVSVTESGADVIGYILTTTVTPEDALKVIADNEENIITVENSYEPNFGDLKINKTLNLFDKTAGETTFVFSVIAKMDDGTKVYDDVVSLNYTANDPATKSVEIIGKIPVGAKVEVKEIYTSGSYEVVGSDTVSDITIVKEKAAEANFTNTYNNDINQGYGILNEYTTADGTTWTHNKGQVEEEGKD